MFKTIELMFTMFQPFVDYSLYLAHVLTKKQPFSGIMMTYFLHVWFLPMAGALQMLTNLCHDTNVRKFAWL